METFSQYIIKPLTTIVIFFKNPIAFIICLPVFITPALSMSGKAIILLGTLFILDFITGTVASYFEFKKKPDQVTNTKHYMLQSSKLRLSVIKFITYGIALLIAYCIEWIFFIDEIKIHVSLQKMTLTTIVAAFCCVIEAYSILFENIKRMGFDIIQKVKDIINKGWELYKIFKDEPKL